MTDDKKTKQHALSSTSIVLYYALFAAIWIAGSDNLLGWLVADREWLTLLSMGKGFLFIALTSFLLYTLLALKPNEASEQDRVMSPHRIYWLWAALIFVVPSIPVLIYTLYGHQIKQDSYSELDALAKSKTEVIENWLQERFADATIIQSDQSFAQAIALMTFGGSADTDAIKKTLTVLQANKSYQAIVVLDLAQQPRVIYGQAPIHKSIAESHPHGEFDVHSALSKYGPIKASWYSDENNHLYFDIAVPLVDSRFDEKIGTLVLTQDLEKNLLPLIQSWPSTSNSGITYLLQPHNDRLSYIKMLANDAIHVQATDKLYNKSEVIVQRALSDKNEPIELTDLNGHQVIASSRPVRFSGWHLLVQKDLNEIYSPVYTLVYWATLIIFFTSLFIIYLFNLVWRQQQLHHAITLQQQASEKDRILRHFFELPLFGMAISHAHNGRFIRYNEQLATLLGYHPGELDEYTLASLTAATDQANDTTAMQRMLDDLSDGYCCEKQLRRKDGQLLFVNIDTRCVRTDNRSIAFFISVIEDISQRKASEQALQHQKNLYNMLSQTNQAIVHCKSSDELFLNICQIAVKHGGFLFAFIGKYYKDKNDIDILHRFGEDNGFSQWITEHKQLQPELISHTGAIQALMNNQHLIINDYQHEVSTTPFHQLAKQANIAATGYFIFREDNEHLGVICLYSDIVNFFNAEIQATLNEMAADVSFALENLRRDNQLQDSEQRFRSAIMNAPSPMVIYAQSGRGITLNHAWSNITGYQLEDIPTREIWQKTATPLHPDISLPIDEFMPLLTDAVHNGEYLIRCTNNSERYWDMYTAPIGKTDNNEPLLLSMGIDITDRMAAELALKKSETLFHTLATFVPVGIFRLDLSGNIKYLNEAGLTLLHCPPTELPQWLDLIVDDDRQKLFQHWLPSLLNNITREIECRINSNDNACKWIVLKAAPETNEDGKTIGFIGSLTDITTQKENEAVLRLSATVFDHTQEGIMITDKDAKIIQVNFAFEQLFGFTAQDVIGKNPRILKSEKQTHDFYQAIWIKLKSVGFWRGEIWNRCKNGELIPLISSISAVKDEHNHLTHYVNVFTDIRQLKSSEAQLKHLAHHDPLTHLPNRSLLAINLTHAIKLAMRHHHRIALIMLDLDRFKDVNDSFGHPIGDVLLQQVAQRLQQRMRTTDTICRLGGDEFTVLIEGNPELKAIDHIAEDILQLLKHPFQLPNGREVVVGASIGISLYPEHGKTPEELLQQADTAMYRAKAHGRSCFRYYSDELTLEAEQRLDMEVRLRRAIELSEFIVYYQPQINIETNQIVGAEALVRWQDPVHGLIMPSLFISIAEETGLIKQLGEWVLFEACRQGNEWLQKGLPPINLAVNVSPIQFRFSNILESVVNTLQATGFPASQLELELTEGALMSHEDEAANILSALRESGVRLAIDDFGTGYSSLAYLKRFPLDVLKIDKSFVDDIPHKKDDMEIAATIVAMAHVLGLSVMAEGVETAEQLAFLKEKGCDCYQGYLMSRPIPAAQFEQLLREHQPVQPAS